MSERQGSAESVVDKREALQPEDAITHVSPESLASAHEVQEVNLRALALFGVGLVVALVAISLVIWWIVAAQTERRLTIQVQIPPALVTPQPGLGPGIEAFPGSERQAVVDSALERITTYGWVDREAGVVHMPIDEAMKRLVEQGVPAADGQVPPFGVDPAYELESEGGQAQGAGSAE